MTTSKAKPDPQSGQEGKSAPAKVPAKDKNLDDQFAEADAKGTPKERRAEINREFEAASDERKQEIIDETQAGLGVRGY